MGSGKTQLLSRLIKKNDWSNILWLSCRKSYTIAMQARLKKDGLEFAAYDDTEHVSKTIVGGRILCQVDSINRV